MWLICGWHVVGLCFACNRPVVGMRLVCSQL
jgi:hypothetical protein